jgi:hypothetical protein
MKNYLVITLGVTCAIESNHVNKSQWCPFRWLPSMEYLWNSFEVFWKKSLKIYIFFIILCEGLYFKNSKNMG